jgi:hypothetical protein
MSLLALAMLLMSGSVARTLDGRVASMTVGRTLSAGRVPSGSAHRGMPGAASLARLRSLPLEAQETISAALGGASSTFTARRVREGWSVRGGGEAASLDHHGVVVVRAIGGWLSIRLVGGIRRASRNRVRDAASLSARANRISFARGGVTEWLAGGPLGIEQGFVVRGRPGGRGDALELRLALRGPLRARLAGQDMRIDGPLGSIRYGGLVAIDARGRRLPANLALHGRSLSIAVDARNASYPVRIDPIFASSAELLGSCVVNCIVGAPTELGSGWFGYSVAISSNGTEALVGAPYDSGGRGAAWAFNLTSGGTWASQAKLVGDCAFGCNLPGATGGGTEEVGKGDFGWSVALSADGTVALIGAPGDNQTVPPNTGAPPPQFPLTAGAAWVFTQSDGTWTQQGDKIVADCDQTDPTLSTCIGPQGTGESAQCPGDPPPPTYVAVCSAFGSSVSLSANGTVALIGAPLDSGGAGAAWVFTGSGGLWSQQAELAADCVNSCSGSAGTGEIGAGQLGSSVSLDAEGDIALIGAPGDNGQRGAAWVFTSTNGNWTQQSEMLTDCTEACAGSSAGVEVGRGLFGSSVSLSGDGDTAAVGAPYDNNQAGAVWILTRSGETWTPQTKLLASCPSSCGGPQADDEIGGGMFGSSVALAGDGSTVIAGAPQDNGDEGAAWLFTHAGGNWSEQDKLIQNCAPACGGDLGTGESGAGELGNSVALAASGSIAAVGAPQDGGATNHAGTGAVWIAAATPVPTAPPVISGAPQVNGTVSCSTGAWTGNPTSFTYQWYGNGKMLLGATNPAYMIQATDLGTTLTCVVAGVNGDGASAGNQSAGLVVPYAAPAPLFGPAVLGVARAGETLDCGVGQWTQSPYRFDIQWARNGVPIGGATRETYRVVKLDEGSALTCVVTAFGWAGNSAPKASEQRQVAAPHVKRCPVAGGTSRGAKFGRITLGMNRPRARAAYRGRVETSRGAVDAVCLTPVSLHIGYPTATLLKTKTKAAATPRAGVNKVIWVTTASPLFSLDGIRAGEAMSSLSSSLTLGTPVKVGTATWYVFGRTTTSVALILVRGGIVQQIGIADSQFARSPRSARVLLSGIR